MNKRKKINQILSKKAKRANAKNNISNKPRYIAKADRQTEPADTELTANP
tara:strand:+ start:4403 stop:4552 length:150 start_codon:yes stop_codon:yes gene_type:complete